MKKILYSTIILLAVILLSGCAERNRDNPLDPSAESTPPLNITIEPQNGNVEISWNVNELKDFTGFRLYRSVGDSSNFQLLMEFPATIRQFTDRYVNFSKWYYYYLTVLGVNNESKPSKIQKIMLGPGETWILSSYGYSVNQLTYDLTHVQQNFNLQFPPVSWAPDWTDGQIWLSTRYSYLTRLNLNEGAEDFFYQKDSIKPTDVQWDATRLCLYILDGSSGNIYTMKNNTLTDSTQLPSGDYFKMALSPDNSKLWAIGIGKAAELNISGKSTRTLFFSEGYQGKDISAVNQSVYAMTEAGNLDLSEIIIYNTENGDSTSLQATGRLELIRPAPDGTYFWVSEKIAPDNYRAVKLSASGQRLLQLSAMQSIDDLQINPVDKSVLVVQRMQNKISLFNSEGKLLSSTENIYDPIRSVIK